MRAAVRAAVLAAVVAIANSTLLPAQNRWSGGPEVLYAAPLKTMSDYFGNGAGFGLSLAPSSGPLSLRIDASWTRFGDRTVTRQLNGSGPPIGITSSANIVQTMLGPEGALQLGGWRVTAATQAGAGYVLSTGSTILPGDPARLQRSTTYTTLTWALAARAGVAHRLGSGSLALGVSAMQLGEADFLREYNLPIGIISGIYLNPTPYAPLFVTLSAALTFPL